MFYAVMKDGTVICAKTQEELNKKVKEWREGN